MAGDPRLPGLVAILSRLTGAPVTADTPVQLRSVQRAALASWCVRQTPPIVLSGAAAGEARTPVAMLGGAGADMPDPPGRAVAAPNLDSQPAGGLGVDLEDVSSMPQADDYRVHPFYTDNFTEAELSYAIRQRDVRATLCGLWAAKEAVVKSGLVPQAGPGLRSIEISHDRGGRPQIAGALLSIGHTPTSAIAVCVVARHRVAEVAAAISAPTASATPWRAPAGTPRPGVVARLATGVVACIAALRSGA